MYSIVLAIGGQAGIVPMPINPLDVGAAIAVDSL